MNKKKSSRKQGLMAKIEGRGGGWSALATAIDQAINQGHQTLSGGYCIIRAKFAMLNRNTKGVLLS